MPLQSTIDAITATMTVPIVVTKEALINSTGDSHIAEMLNRSPGSGLLWIDLPGFHTPQGNRQDRRLQDRVVCWMRAAFRAGRQVVACGKQGAQWANAAVGSLIDSAPWHYSKHRWCGLGSKARATTVLLTSCIIASTLCICGDSCGGSRMIDFATAAQRHTEEVQVRSKLLHLLMNTTETETYDLQLANTTQSNEPQSAFPTESRMIQKAAQAKAKAAGTLVVKRQKFEVEQVFDDCGESLLRMSGIESMSLTMPPIPIQMTASPTCVFMQTPITPVWSHGTFLVPNMKDMLNNLRMFLS